MEGETNQAVKLAATTALANSLEFAKNNMLVENERNLIMTMILSAAASPDSKVRVAAFLCLVKVASLYYDQIDAYMNQVRPNVALLPVRQFSETTVDFRADKERHYQRR